MKELVLARILTSWEGTLGILLSENSTPIARTIELPWRNNIPNLSCIPTGKYLVQYNYSPAFKRKMYLVTGVQGRSGIRIHKGSFAGASDKGFKTNFLGCIAFGRGIIWDKSRKQYLLHTTAVTIDNVERMLGYEDFMLNIKGDFPPLT